MGYQDGSRQKLRSCVWMCYAEKTEGFFETRVYMGNLNNKVFSNALCGLNLLFRYMTKCWRIEMCVLWKLFIADFLMIMIDTNNCYLDDSGLTSH